MQDLFGKSAGRLIPTLNDYADNLDRASTVTTEQGRQADDLNNQWGKLAAGGTRLKEQLAIAALPALTAVTSAFIDLKKESASLGEEKGARTWAERAVVSFSLLYDGARAIPVLFKTAGAYIAGFAVDTVTALEAKAKALQGFGALLQAAVTPSGPGL